MLSKNRRLHLEAYSSKRTFTTENARRKTALFARMRAESASVREWFARLAASHAALYAGETDQPLLQRYKQHIGDMTHTERNKQWSIHMRNCHEGRAAQTKIGVPAVERNLQRRKIKEAIFIDQLKPTVNVRQEMNDALRFLNPL